MTKKYRLLKGLRISFIIKLSNYRGDLQDLPHRGFDCFNTFLNVVRPGYMFHGHVHKSYGHFQRELVHESGTRLINACEYYYIDV